ncbi:hypothetical protein D7Y41_31555 [Anaerotruncus sp. 1XD22-93]|nr:hypothetical protein D7Y41_31555 [Anaerotruncus sp. 1XD22-93]
MYQPEFLEPVFINSEDTGWAREFAALQGEKMQAILCVLQDFSTRQDGERPAQTVSNGCKYGFL